MSHYDWSVKRYLEETIFELRGSLQEAWDEAKEERERYIGLLDRRDKDVQELQAEVDDLKRLLLPKAYVDLEAGCQHTNDDECQDNKCWNTYDVCCSEGDCPDCNEERYTPIEADRCDCQPYWMFDPQLVAKHEQECEGTE